ncbi:hypothetical protein TNCV_3066361 [Trichonephila clavipes]|uniref:Uncharacterized protein n=1 Tax=Trichonephila clavipes TaxID=2585209 RepID=A0A8X6RRX3_TRICX|nr:hypothetical protein TNCV_3066361 [Trichonephila clavipes]
MMDHDETLTDFFTPVSNWLVMAYSGLSIGRGKSDSIAATINESHTTGVFFLTGSLTELVCRDIVTTQMELCY